MDCGAMFLAWHTVGREKTHSSQEVEQLCSMVFLFSSTYSKVLNCPSKKCRCYFTEHSLLPASLHGCHCKLFCANGTGYFHRKDIPEVCNFRREHAPYLQVFLHWPCVLSWSTAISEKQWFLSPSILKMGVPALKSDLHVWKWGLCTVLLTSVQFCVLTQMFI